MAGVEGAKDARVPFVWPARSGNARSGGSSAGAPDSFGAPVPMTEFRRSHGGRYRGPAARQ